MPQNYGYNTSVIINICYTWTSANNGHNMQYARYKHSKLK